MFNLNNQQLNILSAFVSFVDAFMVGCESGAAIDQVARDWTTKQTRKIYREWCFTNFAWDLFKQICVDVYNQVSTNYHVQGICSVVWWATQILFWTTLMVVLFVKEEGWQKRLQPQLAKYAPVIWGWFYSNVLVEEGLEGLGTQAIEFKPEVVRTESGAIPVPSAKIAGYLCAAKKISEVRETEQTCSVELPEELTQDLWAGASTSNYTNQFSTSELVEGAIAGLLPEAPKTETEEVCEEPNKVESAATIRKGFGLKKPYVKNQLNKLKLEQVRQVAKSEGLSNWKSATKKVLVEELIRLK